MDMVFEQRGIDEPKWMTRVSGVVGLKDYLEQVALEKPIETIIVEHITKMDLNEFNKGFFSFIVNFQQPSFGLMTEYAIKGNPIMLSLVIKEYEITDKLLSKIDNISVRSVGRIVKLDDFGLVSTVNYRSHKKNEYSILNHLYEPEFMAEKKLRSKLLSRLANEADDLYDFTLEQTNSLSDEAVKKQFIQDIKAYPSLFESMNCLYANDMDSLLFLIKLFPDDKSIKHLLSNNSIGLYSLNISQTDQMTVIDSDIKCLGNIVKLLQKRIGTHLDLFCFMLKMITELRRKSVLDKSAGDLCAKVESVIWEYAVQIPFEEEDFYQLLSSAESKSFRSEIAYELANRKLEKKMTLYITDDMVTLENTFGLNDDEEYSSLQGFFYGDGSAERKGRLFRLVNNIGAIYYSEEKLQNQKKLKKEIGSFLTTNAELLKDVFADLLVYGFIPKECLDAVIHRVSRNKKCSYMRPLLIAYKFGGLHNDEG